VPGGAGSAPLPYSLDLGPMVHLSADWYPLAHFMTGPATLFGIMLETQQGFGVNTGFEDPDSGESGTFSTVHNSFFAGLRGRIPISDHEIGLFAGWGFHRFAVEEEVQGFSSLVPDVDYKFIQLGLDSRFQLSEA